MLADVRFLGDFVQPNGGFDGFALGEKEGLGGIAFRIEKPELEQLPGDPGRLWVFRLPPRADFTTKQVDDVRTMVRRGRFVQFHQIAPRALTHGNGLDFRRKNAAPPDWA